MRDQGQIISLSYKQSDPSESGTLVTFPDPKYITADQIRVRPKVND
jgi:hypothetical protein